MKPINDILKDIEDKLDTASYDEALPLIKKHEELTQIKEEGTHYINLKQ